MGIDPLTKKCQRKPNCMKNQLGKNAYSQLLHDAISRVRLGQVTAIRAVNKEQIQTYWDLGKLIVER